MFVCFVYLVFLQLYAETKPQRLSGLLQVRFLRFLNILICLSVKCLVLVCVCVCVWGGGVGGWVDVGGSLFACLFFSCSLFLFFSFTFPIT